MSAADRAYTDQEILEQLNTLSGWKHERGAIRRTYQTDGWRGSMLVANAIAFVCETADHHADLTVTWPSVGVALSTHSAGGITPKDFAVARLIDAAVLLKLPPDSGLKGPGKPFVKA